MDEDIYGYDLHLEIVDMISNMFLPSWSCPLVSTLVPLPRYYSLDLLIFLLMMNLDHVDHTKQEHAKNFSYDQHQNLNNLNFDILEDEDKVLDDHYHSILNKHYQIHIELDDPYKDYEFHRNKNDNCLYMDIVLDDELFLQVVDFLHLERDIVHLKNTNVR